MEERSVGVVVLAKSVENMDHHSILMHVGPRQWDERFSAAELPYGERPSLFLVEKAGLLPAGGKALAPGDGGGRNGVWLAERGYDVLSLDYSQVALRRAEELAARRGVRLKTERVDITSWAWPEAVYDVVVAVYLHLPPLTRAGVHASMLRSLRKGGVLVLEAFHADQINYTSGGPRDVEMLYTEKMLKKDFGKAEIVDLRKDLVPLDEGPLHRGDGVLIRLLARRP